MTTAATGDTVSVRYRGTLQDGTEFDSNENREPMRFTLGAGEVIPGFENAVSGMDVGSKRQVAITPDQGYGERADDAVQPVPASIFTEAPSPGDIVSLVAPDGSELMATVVEPRENEVVLDFNHPLAGQTLLFDIELVDVQKSGNGSRS